jgi:uncharacterized protein YwgA
MPHEKRDWILLALRRAPLDRIRLMKALFLFWKRVGFRIPGYFEFKPYLYGPCSFEVYSVLDQLSQSGFVVNPPYPIQQWSKYYLTASGIAEAEKVSHTVPGDMGECIAKITEEVSRLGFYELLRKVYEEAPEFAINSVMRGLLKR